MSCPFKVGDEIIGLPSANRYNFTREGTRWKVVEVFDRPYFDDDMRVRSLDGKQAWPVISEYFCLVTPEKIEEMRIKMMYDVEEE